jgi:hypothetical protein
MSTTDNRDPDQIQREIHQTQQEMSRTADQLGEQFTLRNLFNSLLDKADENDLDTRYLLDGARRNPLALGLISAGAIWLVSDSDAKLPSFTSRSKGGSSGRLGTSTDYDYDPDHRSYLDYMSRVERRSDEDDPSYLRRRDEARGTYLMIERGHDEDHKSYRERLDQATEAMRRRRDQLASSARQRGQQFSQAGQSGARRVAGAYQDNPLIGGLAAACVGAILGSVVPTTRTEREQLGKQGARVLDMAGEKAREYGQEALSKKDELVDKADRKLSGDNNAPEQTAPASTMA